MLWRHTTEIGWIVLRPCRERLEQPTKRSWIEKGSCKNKKKSRTRWKERLLGQFHKWWKVIDEKNTASLTPMPFSEIETHMYSWVGQRDAIECGDRTVLSSDFILPSFYPNSKMKVPLGKESSLQHHDQPLSIVKFHSTFSWESVKKQLG